MTPDPIAREKYLKKLEMKSEEYPGEKVRNFQSKTQFVATTEKENILENFDSATTLESDIKMQNINATTKEPLKDTTTSTSEDSDEDYGDPDIDDGLKPSCIAALCFGR